MIPCDDIVSRHYLRVAVSRGAEARFIAGLNQQGIVVEAHLDSDAAEGSDGGHLAVVTGPVREGRMREVCAALEALHGDAFHIARLRVEDLPPA